MFKPTTIDKTESRTNQWQQKKHFLRVLWTCYNCIHTYYSEVFIKLIQWLVIYCWIMFHFILLRFIVCGIFCNRSRHLHHEKHELMFHSQKRCNKFCIWFFIICNMLIINNNIFVIELTSYYNKLNRNLNRGVNAKNK